jgi:broad specificity phosphatase PhoE
VPVLLIRHAHAGTRKDWKGEDLRRPLSERGQRQARRLIRAVDSFGVQRILSSPYTRCYDTVAPLAKALGIKVEVTDDLAEGHGADALRLVRASAAEKVAFCTHGDIIADVLVPLADEDRLDLGPRPRQAKGSVWVLESTGPLFTKATYLAPLG